MSGLIQGWTQVRGAALLLLMASLLAGQTWAAESLPAAHEYAVRPLEQVERHGFVAVTAAQMAPEDARRDAEGLPFRFALPVEVALTPGNSGTWEDLPDGNSLWRLRLASPGVLSLNLGFTRFDLPAGARLLIYPANDPDRARRCDSEDNGGHNQLWTPVFLTEELVVELLVRSNERPLVTLEVGSVGRGYRLFGAEESPKSGLCNVDVVCPEGRRWPAIVHDRRSLPPRRRLGAHSGRVLEFPEPDLRATRRRSTHADQQRLDIAGQVFDFGFHFGRAGPGSRPGIRGEIRRLE